MYLIDSKSLKRLTCEKCHEWEDRVLYIDQDNDECVCDRCACFIEVESDDNYNDLIQEREA
jgi:hypothetical protein